MAFAGFLLGWSHTELAQDIVEFGREVWRRDGCVNARPEARRFLTARLREREETLAIAKPHERLQERMKLWKLDSNSAGLNATLKVGRDDVKLDTTTELYQRA